MWFQEIDLDKINVTVEMLKYCDDLRDVTSPSCEMDAEDEDKEENEDEDEDENARCSRENT